MGFNNFALTHCPFSFTLGALTASWVPGDVCRVRVKREAGALDGTIQQGRRCPRNGKRVKGHQHATAL